MRREYGEGCMRSEECTGGEGEHGEAAAAAETPERDRPAEFSVRVKLTLHAGERFFGPGICELLEKIDEYGSIQSAAKQMEMSYTKAWKILNRAEKAMSCRLIRRLNGGTGGGSSVLTDQGRAAVKAFRTMERKLQEESERLYEEYWKQ